MKITEEFLAELEAAAKAATQGEWAAVHGGVGCDGEECSCVIAGLGRVADDVGTQDACYIAAAQPAHVLALIKELRDALQIIDRTCMDLEFMLAENRVSMTARLLDDAAISFEEGRHR